MRHKWFILGQLILVALFLVAVFILYPRANLELNGNTVRFSSGNAKLIIISNNPDFSNSRYIDMNDSAISFNLKPGTYYWKASNDIIEGFSDKFTIDSDIGLQIIEKGGNYTLKNVGDVKINVSRTKDGGFVGRIILEPDDISDIENKGIYTGRQDE